MFKRLLIQKNSLLESNRSIKKSQIYHNLDYILKKFYYFW